MQCRASVGVHAPDHRHAESEKRRFGGAHAPNDRSDDRRTRYQCACAGQSIRICRGCNWLTLVSTDAVRFTIEAPALTMMSAT
ncbi:hypothetical protein FKM82_030211 [Ascaphus truei]